MFVESKLRNAATVINEVKEELPLPDAARQVRDRDAVKSFIDVTRLSTLNFSPPFYIALAREIHLIPFLPYGVESPPFLARGFLSRAECWRNRT